MDPGRASDAARELMYILRCEMRSPVSMSDTFALFEDPYNLEMIPPPWLNFQITTPPPLKMREGLRIEYRIRWLGVPVYWRTVITAYEPPFFFVDEQEKGPYVLWRHRHTFEPTEQGTRVRDQVEYILPLGALGRTAHELLIGKQLKSATGGRGLLVRWNKHRHGLALWRVY